MMRHLFWIMLVTGHPALSHAETPGVDLYPADLLQISSTEAFSKYVFLVDKKERKLIVFERDGESIRRVDELPADIGKNDGDKKRENDHRTPEGIYFFQKKLTPPEIPFSLYGKMAFTTDYPNLFDRREQKTGSGIWLHSIPDTVALTRGSRGCVVIRNDALSKVEDYIRLKQTPLIIFDKISYVPKTEHDRRRQELSDWLESWRSAWQSQDIDRYMSFYDTDFRSPGFAGREAWHQHKRRLASTYKSIEVNLHQPFLLLHENQLIIKLLQSYRSDQHTDYGIKTLHAVKSGNSYKIIHEEWRAADEQGTAAQQAPAPVQKRKSAGTT